MTKKTITVDGNEISLFSVAAQDEYFSLTDIAKKFNEDSPADVIANWIRNKDTVQFLGVWEILNNPDFNLVQFEEVKKEAGFNLLKI